MARPYESFEELRRPPIVFDGTQSHARRLISVTQWRVPQVNTTWRVPHGGGLEGRHAHGELEAHGGCGEKNGSVGEPMFVAHSKDFNF